MGVGSGGHEGMPSWIFIHGTNIVDSCLIVLFLGLFCYFLVFFSLALFLEFFSADALTGKMTCCVLGKGT